VRFEQAVPEPQDAIDPSHGVAVNLWRGNYTLVKTYWLFGIVGGLALGLAVGVLLAITTSVVLALFGIATLWAWQVFVSVAIWRSAGKYTGARIWKILARIALVLSFLQLLGATAGMFGF
jgi:hypothetical protein